MCLPSYFHDETDSHSGIFVSAAESIYYEKSLAGKLFDSEFLTSIPCFLSCRMVIIGIFGSVPPNGILGLVIHNDELVFRRTAGVNTCHNVNCSELGNLSLVIAGKLRLKLFVVKSIVIGIVNNLSYAGDPILGKIDVCHTFSSFLSLIFYGLVCNRI